METLKECTVCNNQKVINENHVRHIDGELHRCCPICFKSIASSRMY